MFGIRSAWEAIIQGGYPMHDRKLSSCHKIIFTIYIAMLQCCYDKKIDQQTISVISIHGTTGISADSGGRIYWWLYCGEEVRPQD